MLGGALQSVNLAVGHLMFNAKKAVFVRYSLDIRTLSLIHCIFKPNSERNLTLLLEIKLATAYILEITACVLE